MKRFREGLVVQAHRPVYHSTLGLRVIKKKNETRRRYKGGSVLCSGLNGWMRAWVRSGMVGTIGGKKRVLPSKPPLSAERNRLLCEGLWPNVEEFGGTLFLLGRGF